MSIGKFVRAIRPHGFRATLGSYPPGNSVLGNYHLKGHGTHRSSGIDSEVLGLEVVLPDGTIVRTGLESVRGRHTPVRGGTPSGGLSPTCAASS